MNWIAEHLKNADGFPRPNWETIYQHVEKYFHEKDQNALWTDIALFWTDRIKENLSGDYATHQSDNFVLITTESEKYVSLFLQFLENVRKRILKFLPGIASDDGYGKYVVLIFDDIDQYYAYLSCFHTEDGEFGLSSGIFINQGYGHFAFPHQELSYAEAISVHELTHALVSHLPIPTWLNEGIAVGMENAVSGSAPFEMSNETFQRHLKFWGEREMQEFWSGDAFYRSDEGQELSYHLAQFAVKSLSQDYERFAAFVNTADYSDAGESAAYTVYEGSLGGLISQYFGEGNWAPNPKLWKNTHAKNV